MHFPLIPPYTDVNMAVSGVAIAFLCIVAIITMFAGYSEGDHDIFKITHSSIGLAILVWICGQWLLLSVVACLLAGVAFFFVKTFFLAYKIRLPKFWSSSSSSSNN